ncbi:MAG: hypothetical protein KDD12_06265 [Lewinella sp.]|nr:hypothetical protein [Lewinella sp.]
MNPPDQLQSKALSNGYGKTGHDFRPMTEYEFWFQKQLLEEALLRVRINETGNKDPYQDFLEKENFNDIIYNHFGICGGGFVFADKANNRLLYLHNKKIQTTSDFTPHFIEIPFNFAHLKKNVEQSREKYGTVIDALFIGTRDNQPLIDKDTKLSPEFYYNLPHFRQEDLRNNKFLPFEEYLVEDGLKVIYCPVGEILFHLYCWRLLFKKAETVGLETKINICNDIAEYRPNKKFWEEVREKKGLPEAEWLETLRTRFHESPLGIGDKWEELVIEVDTPYESNHEGFNLYEEYFRFGLIEEDSPSAIVKKEFLPLIRYFIHIAQRHLGWTAQARQNEQEKLFDDCLKESNLTTKQILTNLYTLERRLDIYFEEEFSPFEYIPTLENIIKEFRIDECLKKIAKAWLMHEHLQKGIRDQKIMVLLRELHKKTRFPILPYFYHLTSGEEHYAKEHLVLCLWESYENKVKIRLPNVKEEKEESGVVFLLLTLKPIWHINPDWTFLKNGKSTHCTKHLSEEAFNRLHRMLSFFKTLVIPTIDKAYYGSIIQKQHEQNASQVNIDAFSHELSKVVDNIFESSNISIEQLFKENTQRFLGYVTKFLGESESYSTEEIAKWLIIPNKERFNAWSMILKVWSGRRGKLVFNDFQAEEDLEGIIRKCRFIAKRMFVGAQMRNWAKPESLAQIKRYDAVFKSQVEELGKIKQLKPEILGEAKKFRLYESADADREEVFLRQNAVLRLLIAGITNAYEHTQGHFFLEVKLNEKQTELIFSIINPCIPEKISVKRKKSLGTEPVLRNCLGILKGKLVYFGGFPESLPDEKNYWMGKFEKLPGEHGLWITRFRFPVQAVFKKMPDESLTSVPNN